MKKVILALLLVSTSSFGSEVIVKADMACDNFHRSTFCAVEFSKPGIETEAFTAMSAIPLTNLAVKKACREAVSKCIEFAKSLGGGTCEIANIENEYLSQKNANASKRCLKSYTKLAK